MKIVIEPSLNQSKETYPYDKVSIETPRDDLDIDQALELVHRALVAWGFHQQNIDDYYKEESVEINGIKNKGE